MLWWQRRQRRVTQRRTRKPIGSSGRHRRWVVEWRGPWESHGETKLGMALAVVPGIPSKQDGAEAQTSRASGSCATCDAMCIAFRACIVPEWVAASVNNGQ